MCNITVYQTGKMAKPNGIEVLQQIRSYERPKAISVVM
jgi:hypothetical protein